MRANYAALELDEGVVAQLATSCTDGLQRYAQHGAPVCPPPAPAMPARVTLTFDVPKGATLTNLTTHTTLGAVRSTSVPGGTDRIAIEVSLAGYRDAVVEVVPDHDQVVRLELARVRRAPVHRTTRVTDKRTPQASARVDEAPPPCDARSLVQRGSDLMQEGRDAEALVQLEAALACAPDTSTRRLTFFAACRAKNAPVAAKLYRELGSGPASIVAICDRNGIRLDADVRPRPAPNPNPY
jgi:hypothetical protein